MVRRFSDWLSEHEALVRLLYRLAMLCVLASGSILLIRIDLDLGSIEDRVISLQNEIENIRADLEDQSDDTTPTDLGRNPSRRL